MEPGTPLHIQAISISRCTALTFRYSGTELENWFSPFVSADVTGSVPVHMTYIPAQCWPPHYASLVLQ